MAKKETPSDPVYDVELHMIRLLEKEEFVLDAIPMKAPKNSNERDRTVMFRQGVYSKKQELKVVIGPMWSTVYFLQGPGHIEEIDSAKTDKPLAVINLIDRMTAHFVHEDEA